MRTQRVLTNSRCNQNCTYCTARLPADDLAQIHPRAVRARIDAALAAGASEIILTGGEPTLRADLEALVAYARDGQPSRRPRILLETNATLIGHARARAIRSAGLDQALVNLSGSSAALDAVTRDPGGFEATLAGMRALAGAGVAVDVQAAVVRSTRADLVGLPARLSDGLGARTIWLVVPTESPDASELLRWDEAAETILSVEAEARLRGIAVRFGPDAAIPPCAFPRGARVSHMYSSLTPGGARRQRHRHLEPCTGCLVRDGCSGVAESYLARHPPPEMHPVTSDRARRRLTLMTSVEEQMKREFVTPNRRAPGGVLVEEEIIRINFRCNQSCDFCFVSTHLPSMSDDAIREAIAGAAGRDARIVLSGGEPTLNPRLVEYVALAKASSKRPVELQTNAIKLDDEALVRALVDAGLDDAFVSLHGATAEISDRVTCAPGTFARTVVGLDNLTRTPVATVLNFVLCQENYREFPAFARLVAARWPSAGLNVSFVAPSADVVPRDRALIPRYSDVMPHLAEGISEALERGLNVMGFESMCGLPLCLVPPTIEWLEAPAIPEGYDRGEFVKAAACQACSLESRCYGLRRGYAEMYGTGELRAVSSARAPAETGGLPPDGQGRCSVMAPGRVKVKTVR